MAGSARRAPKSEGALKIEYRPAADLIPYARNSRTHSDSQISQIAASIREFGWTNPILIDEAGTIIAGHGRLLAAVKLKMADVPCIELVGLSEAQRRALVIADNKLAMNAGWNEELLAIEISDLADDGFDIALLGFDEDELADLGIGDDAGDAGGGLGSLSDRFMIPPFSVLNAREGWWQERKKGWLSLGIQSEVGRGANLIERSLQDRLAIIVPGHYQAAKKFIDARRKKGMGDAEIEAEAMRLHGKEAIPGGAGKNAVVRDCGKKAKAKAQAVGTNDWVHQKRAEGELGAGLAGDTPGSGTSIFDPVLTELCYRWFCPVDGLVLDPFAGGSVRGIVAAKLGREYIGHELRAEQVAANRVQAAEICADGIAPAWIEGDSRLIDQTCADVDADFVFSCPPYADLEVYSDNPDDLSTFKYPEFVEAYREIIAKACARLKPDRFAAFVVGDIRDKGGAYRDFVGDTVQAFRDAGLDYYNEAILVTAVGSLPIRAGKQFSASRKLGKTHQNVLIFLKGDGKKAAAACGKVDVAECLAEAEAAAESGNA